ncbi:hypothetical protein [Clostridium folliculivorans]|uniref:Uncharacterized protein n=1 Tax=Clostridium folliculivorans TaxID=2886038 RepID=A0A9W5Y770_9CLOT|nr:hypothetical protein [Clostridium folliculivorans]GKU27597.1 hypothetical protein CFOLD11_44240 [Clostridium folliculivorans]GKU32498.1 hypothetical protein CFB3_46060 [Clostridium folliculivorans]
MELIMNSNFSELKINEIELINGGDALSWVLDVAGIFGIEAWAVDAMIAAGLINPVALMGVGLFAAGAALWSAYKNFVQ